MIVSLARPAVASALFLLAAAASGFLLARDGVVPAVLPLAAVAAVLVIQHPAVILGSLLGATVIFEADAYGFLPVTKNFYTTGAPIELLIMLLAAAVVLEIVRGKTTLRFPEPFTIPLVLLALAVASGIATGWFADASTQAIIQDIRPMIYLIAVPVLVVNVITTARDVLAMVLGAGVLAIYKGFEGTAAWLLGAGRSVEETTLTYYEPTPNFILLLFCASIVAAAMLRARLPWWSYCALPLCAAALVLSYRRSFWIAAAVALVLVLLLTSGLEGRRIILPAMLAIGVGFWILIGGGGHELNVGGAVAERASSLSIQSITSNRTDRYRLDEQRNVRREIRNHPITGLGFGVPWRLYYPIYIPDRALQYYTHVVAFSYWLRMGILGLVAYIAIMATALFTAFRVWTQFPDIRVRAAGLATLAVLVGLVIAEVTASWTGIDYRFSVVFGGVLGWLSAARAAALPSPPHGTSAPKSV